jgi:16S rRNA (cytosine967-C5)-methyltransferase
VALEVVRRVTDEGAYSNLTLAGELRRARLEDPRERALATDLAYGTLRRLLALDRALERHTDRPLFTAPPRARALLRLGAYQLLHTRIPPHAAVSQTVGLGWKRERGFVNAVLRKLAADTPQPAEGQDDDAVSLRTGMAPWAVHELRRLLPSWEVEEAAHAFAARAPLSLSVNRCRATVGEVETALRAAGHEPRSGGLDPDVLLVDGAEPASLPGFRDGRFAVQDQASVAVVRALDPRPGERILDACAGPGGKAALAACLVQPDGRVVGTDAAPRRAGLVATNAARLMIPVAVLAMDARRPAVRGPFHRILVDAPCSGLGSARRRPELLWRPRKEQLAHLARLQVAIATGVAELLAPGGRLVYSVCTFPRAETDAACDAIIRHAPFLEPEAVTGPDGPAERFRLWPHRHEADGMFVAAFRRSA